MGTQKYQHVNHYIAKLTERLWDAFKEAQVLSTSEAERQKWHYDRKANTVSLEPGDMALAKADAYRWRRKVKDQWEEEPYEVECQVAEGVPSYLMKNQQTGHSWVLHQNQLFIITLTEGTHLCRIVQAKQARCTTTTLEEQTQKSETEEAPQSANCPSLAQHQTGRTLLGWVNRRLCVFIQTFPRASLIDRGWKVWHRGIAGVQKSTSVFWQQRYWSHWWGLKDMTNHDYFIPSSIHSGIASSQHGWCETGVLACALVFGVTILS